MKYLFHINHPAQYHLFKHTIKELEQQRNTILVLARQKDVLTQLLDNDGINYINTHTKGRESNLFSLFINFIKQYKIVKKHCKSFAPDVMIGTSFILPWINRKLKIPYINVVEDDAAVIPLYAKLSCPKSTHILAPYVCKLKKWEKKKIGYNSYHEFAFLHPNQFKADKAIAEKYLDLSKKNFLIRFTAFNAHHDYGKQGIDQKTAEQLIQILSSYGVVYISSEKEIPKHLEHYRLSINPNDIHQVIAHANLVIGDSQSMAMEAACLGVPSLRLNDYAGRISVLEELEHKYALTFGFQPRKKAQFIEKLKELLKHSELKAEFQKRRQYLINDKIDTREFFTWLFLNYPQSIENLQTDKELKISKTGYNEKQSKKYTLRKGKTKKSLLLVSLYFATLLFFYLFPLSDSLSLNRYHYLSFRGDHIIHLLIFAPIPYLILPFFLRQTKLRLLKATMLGILIAGLFELTHLFVPYRAFTFEDFASNVLGVVIGAILLSLFMKTSINKH